METNDDAYLDAIQKQSHIKNRLNRDNVKGLGLEDEENTNNVNDLHAGYQSEYGSADWGFDTLYNSDEDEFDAVRKNRKRSIIYNLKCDLSNFDFHVGMIFENY